MYYIIHKDTNELATTEAFDTLELAHRRVSQLIQRLPLNMIMTLGVEYREVG